MIYGVCKGLTTLTNDGGEGTHDHFRTGSSAFANPATDRLDSRQ